MAVREPKAKSHRGFAIQRVGRMYRCEFKYLPRFVGDESRNGSIEAKRVKEVAAEIDRLIERGRLKEIKPSTRVADLSHVRRDERLAAVVAARGTDEWRANGEALKARRAEEMAQQIERRRIRRIDDWEWASFQVPDRKVDVAMDEFEGMLMDASSDLDIPFEETDTIAYDIMVAYLSSEVMIGKPTKAKIALCLRLLTHLSFQVEDALDFVYRHWTNAREVKP